MRILRLDLGPANGTVDFHPFVSVIHGLDEVQREVLTGSLRSLVRGTTSGLSGLVESDGELIELAMASGEVLGPFTTEDVIVAVDTVQLGEQNEAGLRAELDQLRRRAESDAVHVEEIRADLDPTALVTVQHVRQALAGTTPITAAELHREQICQSIEDQALALQSIPPVLYQAKPEVDGVVSRWNAYKQAETEASGYLASLDRRVSDAEAAYRRALEALSDAERRAVPRTLTPEEDARVEELASIAYDRRGRRSKSRTEEQEQELAALLAKVGQETHTAYAMYRIAPTADPVSIAEVERNKQVVERAKHNLDAAKAEFSNDPQAVELIGQLELLKDEARLHLGPMRPADLGAALLALRDETENPAWVEGVESIRAALIDLGVEVDPTIEPTDLPGWAQGWVRQQSKDLAAKKVDVDRVALEAQLSRAEVALDRHIRAMARIDRLEVTAAKSASHATELENRLAVATGEGGVSGHDLIKSIEPLADLVRTEAGSSAPIVLVGDFNTLNDSELDELLGELERLAQGVQLIIVTDRTKAATWASQVGLRRALRSTVVSMRI